MNATNSNGFSINKGIGTDLTKRYNYIWDHSTPVFTYKTKAISLNSL